LRQNHLDIAEYSRQRDNGLEIDQNALRESTGFKKKALKKLRQ